MLTFRGSVSVDCCSYKGKGDGKGDKILFCHFCDTSFCDRCSGKGKGGGKGDKILLCDQCDTSICDRCSDARGGKISLCNWCNVWTCNRCCCYCERSPDSCSSDIETDERFDEFDLHVERPWLLETSMWRCRNLRECSPSVSSFEEYPDIESEVRTESSCDSAQESRQELEASSGDQQLEGEDSQGRTDLREIPCHSYIDRRLETLVDALSPRSELPAQHSRRQQEVENSAADQHGVAEPSATLLSLCQLLPRAAELSSFLENDLHNLVTGAEAIVPAAILVPSSTPVS